MGWLAKGVAVAVVVVILGAVAAITVLLHSRPASLGLADSHSRSQANAPSPSDPLTLACRRPAIQNHSGSGVAGLWQTETGSVVGYRAHEKFAEIESPHDSVARTEQVSGWILTGDTGGAIQVQTGCIAVAIQTLHSVDELPGFNTRDRDKSARDMLGAGNNPYVVFQPYPATLGLDANSAAIQRVGIAGDLQVSGVTRPATFALDVRLQDGVLSAAGNTTIDVGEFGIEVPQEAGGFVQVDPRITLEVSLILSRS
jgi:hypothetical protein